jgi:hypothetical protein
VTQVWSQHHSGHVLGRTADWQTKCVTSDVHQDDADYVRDHAKHDSLLLSRRNPTHGGYERNRSQANGFGNTERFRKDQVGGGDKQVNGGSVLAFDLTRPEPKMNMTSPSSVIDQEAERNLP